MHFKNDFSREIWEQTYKHHDEKNVRGTWERVAGNLATVEKDQEGWKKEFNSILQDFKFVPGGRILSNAGTEWKTAYINCFTKPRSGKRDLDSLDGIFSVLRDQAQTLKSEGGWGCNFSFIRPRKSFIYGIGVESPGAVKFMGLFDKSSEIITAGSGEKSTKKESKGKIRKGAMMGILEVWHPDIEEFVTAKLVEGQLKKFNLSVGATNEFMDRVVKIENINNTLKTYPETAEICKEQLEEVDKWDLIFPDTNFPKYHDEWFGDIEDWQQRGFPVKVHKTIKVSDLWELIMRSTYNRNDPGVIFLDIANKTHCWNYGPRKISRILESNPCGEQTMPDAGCCDLGSMNLTQFINKARTGFDLVAFAKAVRIAVRLLDNVNDISYSPLPEYKASMENLRRIGLGVMGWGSALYLLKVKYGSAEAEKLKKELMRVLTHTATDESVNLAKEKGAFKFCEKAKHADHPFWDQIELPQEIRDKMRKYGIRNSALFSIQPTGNTGILANNVSGGIEPVYMHEYVRTVICPHVPDHIKNQCPNFAEGDFSETEMFKLQKEGDDEILVGKDGYGTVYKIDKNRGLTRETLCEDYAVKILKELGEWDASAPWAVTTTTLSADDHISDMAGFAVFVDAAISKTVNLPNDYTYESFKDIYLKCYKTGHIKGFTTYRDGTMSSVLKSANKEFIQINTESAPKRPVTLPAEIYSITAKGEKYVVAVGLFNGQPYEIFGGHANGFNIKKTMEGEVTKVKRGQYALKIGDLEISDFSQHFTPQEQTIFRLASTMLRHGVPLEFVVDQMQKSSDDIFSLPSAIARVLKKYIKNGQEVVGQECPSCGVTPIVYAEGCKVCKACGWTACS